MPLSFSFTLSFPRPHPPPPPNTHKSQFAQLATQIYITNNRPNVSGLVLSGSADFKTPHPKRCADKSPPPHPPPFPPPPPPQVAESATQMYITTDRPNMSGLVLSGSADFKTPHLKRCADQAPPSLDPSPPPQVAELATQMYITNDRPNVSGLVLSGSADFKTELSQSDMLDPHLQAIVLGVVDVSYGGCMQCSIIGRRWGTPHSAWITRRQAAAIVVGGPSCWEWWMSATVGACSAASVVSGRGGTHTGRRQGERDRQLGLEAG
jgi:hypothetical protein